MKSRDLLRTTLLLIFSSPLGLLGQSPPEKAAESPGWKKLFDGKSLDGWRVTNFGGEGEVRVSAGEIHLDFGASLSGITYTGKLPASDYELELEAKRVDGVDFFCTTTFPVKNSFCSLVVGGWAGAVVGLSNIDGDDASANQTTRYIKFQDNRWYKVRIRVSDQKIECWIDDRQVVDFKTQGHEISTRAEVELSQPLGISAWETRSALRNIRLRELRPQAEE